MFSGGSKRNFGNKRVKQGNSMALEKSVTIRFDENFEILLERYQW